MLDENFDFVNHAWQFAAELFVIGLIFFAIEKIRPAEKTPFFKHDFKKELGLAFLNACILSPILVIGFSFFFMAIAPTLLPHQIFDQYIVTFPLLAQVLIAAFIIDFSTYWRHRFMHRALWRYHAFHHSADHLNWLTSLRLHPVDALAAIIFDTTLLYILGFSGQGIILGTLFVQIYNYFTHANLNLEYDKPLCYVLASPNYHRWHHATDKKSYDKNFCAVFSLLDVIFGTYHHPSGELPSGYGLEPNDQKNVPKGLFAHLLQPIRQDIQKIFKKNKS